MRVFLTIIGAVAGLSLGSGSHVLFSIALGAFAGFAAGEFSALRVELRALEQELAALRKSVAQLARREAESTAAKEPTTTYSPVRPVAPGPTHPTSTQSSTPPPAGAGAWEPYRVASRTGPGGAPTAASGVRSGSHPPRESVVDAIVRIVREYFTGGNTLVRVGIIILFFGVAFLLRYAAEHSHVPIEFRLTGVALGAVVLLALGWKLRAKRAGYALALQGGAVGILYLTVFAGLRVYSVLPPGAAFALLIVVAAFSAALAVLQNSQSFAFLAVSGGFLAPILAATGQGDHIVLFGYYAVLNAGILAIAWFEAWRPLNLLGFLFTFVIGTAWGVLSYQPGFFPSTEPFLILFLLFYVALAILFASRRPPELRGYVDGTLVFGTPIAAFGLQAGMLHDRRFVLAFSALAASALYLAIAAVLHRSRQASQRLLVEAFMALGVLFLTLAVPLALDGHWSAATWALEGAALVWIGCRQDRRLPRACGALLQIAGGVIFCFDSDAPQGAVPILNSAFLGGAMVSAAAIFSAAMLERHRERLEPIETVLAPVLFFWGVLWWLFSGLTEIQRHGANLLQNTAGLLLMAATAVISSELQRRARITFARYSALGLLPAMTFYAGTGRPASPTSVRKCRLDSMACGIRNFLFCVPASRGRAGICVGEFVTCGLDVVAYRPGQLGILLGYQQRRCGWWLVARHRVGTRARGHFVRAARAWRGESTGQSRYIERPIAALPPPGWRCTSQPGVSKPMSPCLATRTRCRSCRC